MHSRDQAGRKASDRAIQLFEKTNVKVKLVNMQSAKDPDEYIKKYGADAFRLQIDRSENHIEYKLSAIRGKYDLENDDERIAYLKDAAKILSTIENPVELAVYITRVAETGKVDPSVLEEESNQVKKEKRKMIVESSDSRLSDLRFLYTKQESSAMTMCDLQLQRRNY